MTPRDQAAPRPAATEDCSLHPDTDAAQSAPFSTSQDAARRRRLQDIDDRPRFDPWHRAWKLDACQLYWLPVSAFPLGHLQREWLLEFQHRFHARIKTKLGALPEVFLQMKVIHPQYRDAFLKNARRFHPMFSLGRHPQRSLPPLPDERYVEDLQKGRVQYDAQALQPDYTYWFLEKYADEQLALFFGSGGTTTLFLDPGEPPPALPKPNLAAIHDPKLRAMAAGPEMEDMMARLHALKVPFLKQSKEMFAADLEEDPQYPGLLFTLPLLSSEDFFATGTEEIERWFKLFHVYWRESPEDKGVILASRGDIEGDLEDVLLDMRENGLEYNA